MNKKLMAACFAAVSTLSAGLAYSEENQAAVNPTSTNDDFHITFSAKMWSDSWNSWSNASSTGTKSILASATPLIGGVTLKYQDVFFSANYAPYTSYDFTPSGHGIQKRTEYDFNIGYYFHPQVALSFGMKEVDMDYGPGALWQYTFPIIGINAAAPISGTRAFMYGNGAMGVGVATVPSFATGYGAGNPTYTSMEAGLGYSFTKSFIGTLGYKFQQIEMGLNTYSATTRDITTGIMTGVAFTF